MTLPNYDRSILSTTSSILSFYGSSGVYPTLPELDAQLASNPRHVMLVIIDGTGEIPLKNALGEDSYLRSHRAATVTSIYPSTTTAATTCYYNGQSAYEHGWLGWNLYMKEYATDVTTFMRKTYYTEKPVDGPHAASSLMPYETVFDKIKRSAPDVRTRTLYAFDSYCEHGADERLRAGSFREMCDQLAYISRLDERGYSIAYWGEPDSSMHAFGVGSKEALKQFAMIDSELARLSARLKDTLLIVTADHGLINSRSIDLNDDPKMMEMLIMPPEIESRCACFYVKPHRKPVFEAYFNMKYANFFTLLSRENVYRTGIFGRGARHPKFDDFIGDYVACAISDRDFRYTPPGYDKVELVGRHAGLTEDEMLVPVIIDRK